MTPLSTRRQKNAWAAYGALAALAAAAFIAWRWTGSLEEAAAPEEVAMQASSPAPGVAPTDEPILVDVLDVPAEPARTAPVSPQQLRPQTQASSARPRAKEAVKGESAKGRKAKEADAPITSSSIQCSIAPLIETYQVPDLNYGLPVTLSMVPLAGDVRATASKTGLIESRPVLTFPLKLGATARSELQLVVDHPDAMRETIRIRRWGHQSGSMSAAPSVVLRPIECRIELGRMQIVTKKDRAANRPSWFSGTAYLVALEAGGGLRVIDSLGVGIQERRHRQLRYEQTGGQTLVLGIPGTPTAGADLIELSQEAQDFPSDGSVHVLPISLRGWTPTPIQLEIMSPFGELLKDATVTATVNGDYVARRDQWSNPVRFGEFVFVKDSGLGNGQSVSGGEASRANLGLARANVSGTSGANGLVKLAGIDARVYTFQVESPFGDVARIRVGTRNTTAPQVVVAPMGGIEVHCPLIWRKDEAGRAAWARAKVKLSGRSKRLPFSKADARARSPRRFLVPASREITIRCEAKGSPKMSRTIQGPGQREVTAHFPEPSKTGAPE